MYETTRCIERMEIVLFNRRKMTDSLILAAFGVLLFNVGCFTDLNSSNNDEDLVEVCSDYSYEEDDEPIEVRIEANDVVFIGSSYLESEDEEEIIEEVIEDDEEDLPVLNLKVEKDSGVMYATEGIKVYSLPTKKEYNIGELNKDSKVEITGKCGKWKRITYNSADGFVLSKYLTSTKPEPKEEPKPVISNVNTGYSGSKLTKSKGVNRGPSGKETYYNLPMQGVVNIMRRQGFSESEYPYWVREDGVKMLGNYVMVAANLDLRPRGSKVPTSLGMGLVCDTGGFARNNRTQLDIATSW